MIAALVVATLVSQVAIRERVGLPCFSPQSVLAAMKDGGLTPHGMGVDGDGDLWTLWRSRKDEFVLTVTMASDGAMCITPLGQGWAPAGIRA